MTRYFFLFLLLLLILFTAELTPWVQQAFVVPYTAGIANLSGALMQLWDTGVLAQDKVIWDSSSGFAVSIEAGCNGVEAGIVLLSAVLAFPATSREKLIGIGVGLATVQLLNILRIVTLFYLGQWSETVFQWAHLYLWQALIMLDVLLVFLLWLRWISARHGFARCESRAY